ncbi:ubiquinone biosynthesis protein COQ8, mitochondrial [Brevipalpus obovatus]|uniref:ubiquinone biosynthesis protein COQ8, mitochondrial n=1 Tax=Brevipalpus obovatus TaxID=246614 RepID=UPI003D9DE91D
MSSSSGSGKVLLHFLKTGKQSAKIVLGLRGNEQQIKLYQQSLQNHAVKCAVRVDKQLKKVSVNKSKPPDPKEWLEKGTVVARGVQEFVKLAGSQASRIILSQVDNVSGGTTGASAPRRKHELDLTVPKEKRLNIDVPIKQELGKRSRERKVPATRLARLSSFGVLAGQLAVNTLKDLTVNTFKPKEEKADFRNYFLSEENAKKIVDTLCRTRGAGLKIGQMLSLQDNTMISPQLQAIFERVRQSADFMPYNQMEKVLVEELGESWQDKVQSLDPMPFAAASIGQVHRVTLKDGSEAAMKVQYPGVAESIDSDIKNLVSILNLWNVFPDGLFIEPLVKVGRKELMWEVDYIREAECTRRFRQLMEPYFEKENFYVPKVVDELSTRRIFTSEMVKGIPVDKLCDMEGISQEICNSVAKRLLRLCLREVFIFRYMQTDPNWSNFFYDPPNDIINLLDFGATREFSQSFVDKYKKVIHSAALQDREGVTQASKELGFLTGHESKIMVNAHVEAVMILGEAFSHDGEFDFGSQNTTKRINDLVPVMLAHRLTPPPEETYSLHRKTAGVFLLCTRLKANINCKELYDDIHDQYLALKSGEIS